MLLHAVVDDQADENADDNENNLKVNKYHFIRLMDILVEAVWRGQWGRTSSWGRMHRTIWYELNIQIFAYEIYTALLQSIWLKEIYLS